MIYHVAKQGSDDYPGTKELPFLTIQKAADVAAPGDTVCVHAGVYREWVRPQAGGLHDHMRITYEAAQGEEVVIKGSQRWNQWEPIGQGVWKAQVPNAIFENYNPYATAVGGDWLVGPREWTVHCGDVYLNGQSFFEARSLEEVYDPKPRSKSEHETWQWREEKITPQEWTIYQWYSVVGQQYTTIYANFHAFDPNEEEVEINVRKACFMPERTGINYITVRGFEMAHAATPWSPPTADQAGLLSVRWSKGWIIENNKIHDSKCAGICLGKEGTTGDQEFTKYGRKPGYQYQMEAVFHGIRAGWSKENIGSHIVRNNEIYNCGQNGIVGHMGSAFCEIYKNEIHHIGTKHEFYGHELGGIKFHAAVDTQIHHNYIHDCTLGTWLDWQTQGVRVSSNIYADNNRDFMVEVSHGPFVVDHNLFMDAYSIDNFAQGGAYVNNLICGFMYQKNVMKRGTPYHLAHSTDVMGTAIVYGGDDRWYQNVFVGGTEENKNYGTANYNDSPVSMEEYIQRIREKGFGDVEKYEKVKQPAYITNNAYLNGAQAFDREDTAYIDAQDYKVTLAKENEGVYLKINLPSGMFSKGSVPATTESLGMARIPEQPDGTALQLNRDLLGTEMDAQSAVGPIYTLKPGENSICIWKYQ